MDRGDDTRDPSTLPYPDRRYKRARLQEGDPRAYALVDLKHVEAWLAAHGGRIDRQLTRAVTIALCRQMRHDDVLPQENPHRLLFYLGCALKKPVLEQIKMRLERQIVLPRGAWTIQVEARALVLNATPQRGVDLVEQLHLAFDGELAEPTWPPRRRIRIFRVRRKPAA